MARASTEWPSLPLEAWLDTYATVHRMTQVVGKIRLALAPRLNHYWQVALYLTARGLTTSPMPYEDGEVLQIDFDFIDHKLVFTTSRAELRELALRPRPLAEFYGDVRAALADLGVHIHIWDVPVEIPGPQPHFAVDHEHQAYDAEYVNRCWRVLLRTALVMHEFRGRFSGKCSPVHFFWGSFDLAVTRFSGRPAQVRPNADFVAREAYHDECMSVGFWPGSPGIIGPAFYAYAAPEPQGFRQVRVPPATARYHAPLGEFLLPYDDVRTSPQPESTLLDFFQSTYEAAAELGNWDRARLERPLVYPVLGKTYRYVTREQPSP